MGEVQSLPAPKWWHQPELAALIAAPGFMVLAWAILTFMDDTSLMPLSVFIWIAALLAIGVVRASSYQTPDLRFVGLFGFYQGVYFGLFLSCVLLDADATWQAFTGTFLMAGLFFGLTMAIFQRPYTARYDWMQIYLDQPRLKTAFVAEPSLFWPVLALLGIFGVLAATRSPAWAILAGAALLAFTPPAYTRNPATARPVLSRLLNLLAVCLIAVAAITLIHKGH